MRKIRLNVLGISYSQTQTGAYALILSEEEGSRRIPIIIGGFEAQAIAIQLEGLTPPRPLTHDLFFSFAKSYQIGLTEVNISRLHEGVFFSKLTCFDGSKEVEIDARTSDAIALALRFKCPIYTTSEIIEQAGIILDEQHEFESELEHQDFYPPEHSRKEQREELKDLSDEELKIKLDEAIKSENYEKASIVQNEINARKKL